MLEFSFERNTCDKELGPKVERQTHTCDGVSKLAVHAVVKLDQER